MSEYLGQCFVYIVCHENELGLAGPVKVGITSKLKARLSQLRTGNPRKLVFAFVFRCHDRRFAAFAESAFHSVYAEKRITGEWFDMRPRDALAGMCENIAAGLRRISAGDHSLAQTLAEATFLTDAEKLLAQLDRAEVTGAVQ